MPKYKLKPVTALDNYQANINGVKISEIVNIEIFSFAIKLNDEKKAASSMKRFFMCKMPSPGTVSIAKSSMTRIIRLSDDQLFLLINSKQVEMVTAHFEKFSKCFYITEQTDSWSGVNVSGVRVLECLERICPINLSDKNFPVNSFARTAMEHLNTLIIRNKLNEFELYSARSSAQSFLHAIETSAKNI